MLKASHYFNLLDARHAISVTERQRFILRVRTLSRLVAETYYATREALGFPLIADDFREEFMQYQRSTTNSGDGDTKAKEPKKKAKNKEKSL